MNKYLTLSLLAIFILVACQKRHTNKFQWLIETSDNKTSIIDLKKFKDDSVEVKIPKNWNIKISSDIWKYFPYDENNPKLYFAIQKYNSNEIGMNSKEYVMEGFKQVSDKIDKFHYTIKRLSLKNGKVCYLSTIFTNEKGINYITYSLVCESDSLIYDFAFKVIENEKDNIVDYRKFLLIAQSFEFNNIAPIGNETIIKEEEIKFEDI